MAGCSGRSRRSADAGGGQRRPRPPRQVPAEQLGQLLVARGEVPLQLGGQVRRDLGCRTGAPVRHPATPLRNEPGVDAEPGIEVGQRGIVLQQLGKEVHVHRVAEGGQPGAQVVGVPAPGQVGEGRDRRHRLVPDGLPLQRLTQSHVQRPRLQAVVGAEPPVGDRPGHRVAQQHHDVRLTEDDRGAGRGERVLEVAGALLPEDLLVGRVGEVRRAVPLPSATAEVVGEEHLGLRPRGTGHRDLGVLVEQPVQVRRAAALATDDEQVPGHEVTRSVTR